MTKKGQKKGGVRARAKTAPVGRFRQTAKELRKITEEIAPFVRVQKFTEYTSAGQWRGGSPEQRFPTDDESQLVY